MNITSKRLDKIKKTKNQSKRRIHYKYKKNSKEKNRRNKRKYNNKSRKYIKTRKQKKKAYNLKHKSLKFKETDTENKPIPLKIITQNKPVETIQKGGKDTLKKILEKASNLFNKDMPKQLEKLKEQNKKPTAIKANDEEQENIKENLPKSEKFIEFIKKLQSENKDKDKDKNR